MLPNYLLYLVFIMLLRLYTSVICFMEYVIHILLCASLSSFTFIDVVLVAGTGPWWEYLHHRNQTQKSPAKQRFISVELVVIHLTCDHLITNISVC